MMGQFPPPQSELFYEFSLERQVPLEHQLRRIDTVLDLGVLRAHLAIVTKTLGEAERQLWAEDITLSLDPMNIQRDARHPSARRIVLQELHNARGRRAVMLPISLVPRELPPREDFLTAAQRYLWGYATKTPFPQALQTASSH